MKKGLALWMLLCILMLNGCNGEAKPPETEYPESQTTVQETQMPTMPVEEDVFYFSNELEFSRLYSQRTDGTDLKLVLDVYCYGVKQAGDTVYYLDGNSLCTYHIPTGTHQAIIRGVMDYVVDGDDLVYMLDGDEVFYTDLWYRNIKTGEDVFIESMITNGMALSQGKLYYSHSDFEVGSATLKVFDTETRQTTVIGDQYTSCYSLQATPEGLYYQAGGWDYVSQWYFASADGSSMESLAGVIPEDMDVVRIAEDGILYMERDYLSDGTSNIIFRDADGTDTLLFESEESAYIYMTDLGQDRWLINHQMDEGIGEMNEYGYYDDYAYHTKYYLLDADGSATVLNTAGTIGSMFASGDFPVIDSSTAREPVTQALYDLFVENYNYEGSEPLCSTTHGAWLNIADRKADLALLAAPIEEEKAYLEQQGVEVEMKLYGGDGLVFIGNAANPVTDLTHEQIIGIYRGKITNWSQVGGPDREITVYYRDDQSGSQRLFENLVFKGLDIPDFQSMGFAYMDDMSTIVDIVLENPYSIGYSIMTYLDEVYAEEDLQVFGVNGVKPSPDTIKDCTYPYHTQGYLVIRSDEPADSPARRLFNWFGCPTSDDLLTFNGVTPLSGGVG